jgi:hypothetical protein
LVFAGWRPSSYLRHGGREVSTRTHATHLAHSPNERRLATLVGFAIPARVAHGNTFVRSPLPKPYNRNASRGARAASRESRRGPGVVRTCASCARASACHRCCGACGESRERYLRERTAGIGKKRVSDARRAEIAGGPSSAGDAGHETRATRRGVGRRSCAVSVTYPCCIPLPDVPVRVEKGEGEDGDPHLCRARVRVFERKTRESRFPCGN